MAIGSLCLLASACGVDVSPVSPEFASAQRPAFSVDPPSPALADEIWLEAQRYYASGDLDCRSYGEEMAWALLEERINVEPHMFAMGGNQFGSGRSWPSSGLIEVASHLDRPGMPLLNPRSARRMAETVFHESIHLVSGNRSEAFVLSEMIRCRNPKGGGAGGEV